METSITTNKGQIVIPKRIRRKYGIKPGTKIAIIEKNGEIILKAMTKEYFESFAGILKGEGSILEELMKEKAIEREL
ncbi:MAG: AbrB/MazE/SpoVT family DNA-binding domain-containing protein [Bacteroidetes bacterium]|nr:AbrB/MazE/SpoVT family DNA-binding domain-containing protein [Bacteroidota bacterium]